MCFSIFCLSLCMFHFSFFILYIDTFILSYISSPHLLFLPFLFFLHIIELLLFSMLVGLFSDNFFLLGIQFPFFLFYLIVNSSFLGNIPYILVYITFISSFPSVTVLLFSSFLVNTISLSCCPLLSQKT